MRQLFKREFYTVWNKFKTLFGEFVYFTVWASKADFTSLKSFTLLLKLEWCPMQLKSSQSLCLHLQDTKRQSQDGLPRAQIFPAKHNHAPSRHLVSRTLSFLCCFYSSQRTLAHYRCSGLFQEINKTYSYNWNWSLKLF